MEITIDNGLVDMLNVLAAANATTPEEYASGVLNAHLTASFRKTIADDLNARPIEEIATIASAIKDTAQTIDAEKIAQVKPGPLPVFKE